MNSQNTLVIDDEHYVKIADLTTTAASNITPIDVEAAYSVRMKFRISEGKIFIVTPSFSMTMDATTGTGSCLNNSSVKCQSTSWEGPLPVGRYIVKPEELSSPGLLKNTYRNIRHGDWGNWRIRLHPKEGEDFELYGRDGFFLHGGSLLGSAGCIDIGGGILGNKQTAAMRTIIRISNGPILVEVLE
ncbi:tlde1 domain-containing protein [Oceanimonas smirnovii]|uniref:tlde1 domain-containing protein n=1 Tax=Oceanimonas smirnovii TaxID=264574 RepID=UPI0012EA3676|nr:tlde1 domain-containing protein [Oceanimonas smirnovii]